MFYKIKEANENGEVTKEQIEWLLNAHVSLAETLMYIYIMTLNVHAKQTLNDLGILTSIEGERYGGSQHDGGAYLLVKEEKK